MCCLSGDTEKKVVETSMQCSAEEWSARLPRPHGMHIGGGHTEVGAATSKSSPGECIHTKGVSADIAKPLYAALFIFM